MDGNISSKVKVPSQSNIRIRNAHQVQGDRIHKIDKDGCWERGLKVNRLFTGKQQIDH